MRWAVWDGVWSWLVTPLMLGTLWAYVPALLTVAVLVVRTALEDRTLIRELAGYAEYTRRTQMEIAATMTGVDDAQADRHFGWDEP